MGESRGTYEVSGLWREDGPRLEELRKRDRVASLAARWAWLERNRPEIAARDFGYFPKLLEHGWVVVAVPEDDVAYTLGLFYNFDQPEILLAAPGFRDAPERARELQTRLNELGMRVKAGERFASGDAIDADGARFALRAYEDDDFDAHPSGYLAGFEELFADRFHDRGGTLPILWTTLEPFAPSEEEEPPASQEVLKKVVAKAAKRPTKKAAKKAAKKSTSKERSAKKSASKKVVSNQRGSKKSAAKKGAAKEKPAKKRATKTPR